MVPQADSDFASQQRAQIKTAKREKLQKQMQEVEDELLRLQTLDRAVLLDGWCTLFVLNSLCCCLAHALQLGGHISTRRWKQLEREFQELDGKFSALDK